MAEKTEDAPRSLGEAWRRLRARGATCGIEALAGVAVLLLVGLVVDDLLTRNLRLAVHAPATPYLAAAFLFALNWHGWRRIALPGLVAAGIFVWIKILDRLLHAYVFVT
ncbi:MAG: hypothetical protein KatS3mg119_0465 [Rhodothalassiaceae bacterium]|nr:MAG: hypothetical protein KatS3mg119_0465 [Rhodothalassiaceae bacterium]